MSRKNPKVDEYLTRAETWREEFTLLREILLQRPLSEEFKWGHPCYTTDGKNVVLIHGFKQYCALLFFKGALLKDPKRILITQTENVQVGRQIRFTHVRDIVALEPTLKAYVDEAVEVQKSGVKVNLKKTSEFTIPEELQTRLNHDRNLKNAFASLTPGRQRAYLLHFSSAKQSKTRESRIEKCLPQIMKGKGLDD